MTEQLYEPFMKVYLEVNPEIFNGIEIRRLSRSFHDRNMIFLEKLEDCYCFMICSIILYENELVLCHI
jgi:hypothetical protein